jgi:hypothetical protein
MCSSPVYRRRQSCGQPAAYAADWLANAGKVANRVAEHTARPQCCWGKRHSGSATQVDPVHRDRTASRSSGMTSRRRCDLGGDDTRRSAATPPARPTARPARARPRPRCSARRTPCLGPWWRVDAFCFFFVARALRLLGGCIVGRSASRAPTVVVAFGASALFPLDPQAASATRRKSTPRPDAILNVRPRFVTTVTVQRLRAFRPSSGPLG